jgi:hypothetical protein
VSEDATTNIHAFYRSFYDDHSHRRRLVCTCGWTTGPHSGPRKANIELSQHINEAKEKRDEAEAKD